MGDNAVPPPPAVPEQPALSLTAVDAERHYTNLLAYFKDLVWITAGAVTIIVGIATFLFVSSLRDVRQDAKDQAIRIASDEAKNGVKNAFDEKNINELILKAAKDKVGTVTDNMIEEQLKSKLRPIEERIVLIGRISECEARIHTGFRSALVELTNIVNTTHDPTALSFAKSTLASTTEGYETYYQRLYGNFPSVPNLHNVLETIDTDQDLNGVAQAFITFRNTTKENVKMFDFAAVHSWCAKHQTECK